MSHKYENPVSNECLFHAWLSNLLKLKIVKSQNLQLNLDTLSINTGGRL